MEYRDGLCKDEPEGPADTFVLKAEEISDRYDEQGLKDAKKREDGETRIGVTKKIKKTSHLKKNYDHVTDEMRLKLIDAVDNKNEKIKHAAQRLGINYSSAKSIWQIFKKEGRSNRMIIKRRGYKAPEKIEKLRTGFQPSENSAFTKKKSQIISTQSNQVPASKEVVQKNTEKKSSRDQILEPKPFETQVSKSEEVQQKEIIIKQEYNNEIFILNKKSKSPRASLGQNWATNLIPNTASSQGQANSSSDPMLRVNNYSIISLNPGVTDIVNQTLPQNLIFQNINQSVILNPQVQVFPIQQNPVHFNPTPTFAINTMEHSQNLQPLVYFYQDPHSQNNQQNLIAPQIQVLQPENVSGNTIYLNPGFSTLAPQQFMYMRVMDNIEMKLNSMRDQGAGQANFYFICNEQQNEQNPISFQKYFI